MRRLIAVLLVSLPLCLSYADFAQSQPTNAPQAENLRPDQKLRALLMANKLDQLILEAPAALAETRASGNLEAEANVIQYHVGALRRLNRPAEGEALVRDALESGKWPAGSAGRPGLIITYLGALLEQGQAEGAAALAQREQATFDALPPQSQSKINFGLIQGATFLALNRPQDALEPMGKTARLMEANYPPSDARPGEAWEAVGTVLNRLERHEEAIEALRKALFLGERANGPASIQAVRSRMNLSRNLLQSGQIEEAANTAKVALDLLPASFASRAQNGETITDFEARIASDLNTPLLAKADKSGDPAEQIAALERTFWSSGVRVRDLLDRLGPAEQTQTAIDLRALQQKLGRDEVLFLAVDQVDATYTMAITRTATSWAPVALPRNMLCARVAVIRSSIAPDVPLQCSEERTEAMSVATRDGVARRRGATRPAFARIEAHRLYADLLGPHARLLRGKPRLTIISTGVLGAIPWAALPSRAPTGLDGDPRALRATSWLVKTHTIQVAPSLQAIAQRRPAAPTINAKISAVLLLGGAQTGDAGQAQRSELSALAQATPPSIQTVMRTGLNATFSNWSPIALGGVLVVAGHGGNIAAQVQGRRRTLRGISLSGNDALTAQTVIMNQIKPEFVILAGCDLAIADPLPGDDPLGGLHHAFFRKGTVAILSANAPIIEGASLPFTKAVHIDWLGTNPVPTPGAALARTQRRWIANSSDSFDLHPATWASSVVISGQ